MDFVASRAVEKKTGWRTRIGEFLRKMGVTVFDPWEKPEIRGMHEYGKEGEGTTNLRNKWTFKRGKDGAQARAEIAESFWPALHVDLRMVDTSDFIVCYCPTNIYSVGTPHEIILAREQKKPVLFVSPYVTYQSLARLQEHLAEDKKGLGLLDDLKAEVPIHENRNASPSLWYMPLIGGEHFFDGFGFNSYRTKFGWSKISMDQSEDTFKPLNPLLPFIEKLNHKLPPKWDRAKRKFVANDNWLLWDLRMRQSGGSVVGPRRLQSKKRMRLTLGI
jgi:hypothetical protein